MHLELRRGQPWAYGRAIGHAPRSNLGEGESAGRAPRSNPELLLEPSPASVCGIILLYSEVTDR